MTTQKSESLISKLIAAETSPSEADAIVAKVANKEFPAGLTLKQQIALGWL